MYRKIKINKTEWLKTGPFLYLNIYSSLILYQIQNNLQQRKIISLLRHNEKKIGY